MALSGFFFSCYRVAQLFLSFSTCLSSVNF